jgi:hypothetical protein
MSTAELQESIIQKIRLTNDEELLNYLNQLLSDEEEQKNLNSQNSKRRCLLKVKPII